jgi:hypothetical protein
MVGVCGHGSGARRRDGCRRAVAGAALVVLALVFLVGAAPARAVNASFRGVDFITASSGWVVGRSATIMHTSNGGRTWVRQHREATGPTLTDVNMRNDGLHGWAVGDGAAVYRTVDGRHWTRVSSMVLDPGLTLTSVRFVSGNIGWACGGRLVSPSVMTRSGAPSTSALTAGGPGR